MAFVAVWWLARLAGAEWGRINRIVDWGTAPQWFSAFGTVGALGVGATVLWRQVADGRRAQARLVSSLVIKTGNASFIVVVTNTSQQLAYQLELVVGWSEDVRRVLVRERRPHVRPNPKDEQWAKAWPLDDVIKAHGKDAAVTYPDDILTWIAFRDDAGREWHRNWQGHLRPGRRLPHDVMPD